MLANIRARKWSAFTYYQLNHFFTNHSVNLVLYLELFCVVIVTKRGKFRNTCRFFFYYIYFALLSSFFFYLPSSWFGTSSFSSFHVVVFYLLRLKYFNKFITMSYKNNTVYYKPETAACFFTHITLV